jgi:hypothetical protein
MGKPSIAPAFPLKTQNLKTMLNKSWEAVIEARTTIENPGIPTVPLKTKN